MLFVRFRDCCRVIKLFKPIFEFEAGTLSVRCEWTKSNGREQISACFLLAASNGILLSVWVYPWPSNEMATAQLKRLKYFRWTFTIQRDICTHRSFWFRARCQGALRREVKLPRRSAICPRLPRRYMNFQSLKSLSRKLVELFPVVTFHTLVLPLPSSPPGHWVRECGIRDIWWSNCVPNCVCVCVAVG